MTGFRAVGVVMLIAIAGCARSPAPTVAPVAPSGERGVVRAGTPDEVNIVKARASGREQLFAWQPWSEETFARAKREGRKILIHGAAEWCHWCHVMEATTYRDPAVGQILRDQYVAIKVDVDARPDIEERYGEWGWPATIVLSADAEELGKYRGYVPPAEMRANLEQIEVAGAAVAAVRGPREGAAPPSALFWIGAEAASQMDDYYDEREGGWGMRQKAPIGDNVLFELRRAAHGDRAALERAVFSLNKQAALIDPVWGGIYQYSAGRTWQEPHYEKLMSYQAPNLEAYARAYALSGDAALLAHARSIERYLGTFLSGPDGAFYVTQDADVGAHDPSIAFVDGDVYYRLGDAERRKHGIPRVDEHVYAEENGLAIAALATLYEATKDAAVLARAEKAAALILKSHVDEAGHVKHDAASTRAVYYAADAAAFGFGLTRLAEVAPPERAARYREAATRIAETLWRELHDEVDGGLWANTPDPDASGVFVRRIKPYPANVMAARLFAAIGRAAAAHEGDAAQRERAQAVLAAVATPSAQRERGRMIGSFLLAADEAGALRW